MPRRFKPKKEKSQRDPLGVVPRIFERHKEKPIRREKKFYKDPLGVAPTLNPFKALRRWRKRRAKKKSN